MSDQPNPLVRYSDAARRMSDIVNFHVAMVDWGRWVAIRLSDGGYDGTVYDKRADAIRHQLHETLCSYIKIPPTGMSPRQASNMLKFQRGLYDMGMRIIDPEREVVMPMNIERMPR